MRPVIVDNGTAPPEPGETVMTYGQAADFLGISSRSLER